MLLNLSQILEKIKQIVSMYDIMCYYAFYFQHYIIVSVFLEVTEALHTIGLESLYEGEGNLWNG